MTWSWVRVRVAKADTVHSRLAKGKGTILWCEGLTGVHTEEDKTLRAWVLAMLSLGLLQLQREEEDSDR